jgi:hypothetical protein
MPGLTEHASEKFTSDHMRCTRWSTHNAPASSRGASVSDFGAGGRSECQRPKGQAGGRANRAPSQAQQSAADKVCRHEPSSDEQAAQQEPPDDRMAPGVEAKPWTEQVCG